MLSQAAVSFRSRYSSALLAAAAVSGTAYAALNREGTSVAHAEAAKPASTTALDPNEFRAFKLKEKKQLTKNTFLYRFELPDNQTSGIFTASCLVTRAMLKAKPEDDKPKAVIRPYTPTSANEARGYLDLVVKVYDQISLVYASVSESDIILKDKLDALAAAHPAQLSVHYVVDKAAWGGLFWKGSQGRVSKELLAAQLPAASKDSLVMVCGPPGMMVAVSGNKAPDYSQGEVSGLLKELGFDSSNVYKF
ncbi:hypothetical protein CHLRE_11g481126v5 [Chlamydomonas reinhardtii]|uniref:FAD-binding FR-type domain-containing protein n=1 Tax=Chlamydomonas reinhardtii TaxID=3055 RepID=A0A2K3D8R9_CHLRE|nr:uncharacterized protein CHLRE_11g481126v5 [Chlamydomonas reinhardtii]PNW76917.1 hypothetical protein CHLRE_11g481126v5 [Chlamydomonas reinhardtii]